MELFFPAHLSVQNAKLIEIMLLITSQLLKEVVYMTVHKAQKIIWPTLTQQTQILKSQGELLD